MDWLGGKTESVAATARDRAGRVADCTVSSGAVVSNEACADRSTGDGVACTAGLGGKTERTVATDKDLAGTMAKTDGSGAAVSNEA